MFRPDAPEPKQLPSTPAQDSRCTQARLAAVIVGRRARWRVHTVAATFCHVATVGEAVGSGVGERDG